MLRRAMTGVGLSGAVVMASLVLANPAYAADHSLETTDGVWRRGAKVEFSTNGDVVRLCDQQADDWAAYVRVYDNDAKKRKYTYTIGGEGRCQTLRASLGGEYNLAERHTFNFKVCLKRGSTLRYCNDRNWANVN